MTDLQELFRAVDELTGDELKRLFEYVEQRRRTTWWIVPAENITKLEHVIRPIHDEAARMSEEEINTAIDDAITEIRRN